MRDPCVLHGGAQLGIQQLTVHIKCGHSFISAEDCRGAISLRKLSLSTSSFLTRLLLYNNFRHWTVGGGPRICHGIGSTQQSARLAAVAEEDGRHAW